VTKEVVSVFVHVFITPLQLASGMSANEEVFLNYKLLTQMI
jgi:hypothetical protein